MARGFRRSTTWCGRITSTFWISGASFACSQKARAWKVISRNSRRPTSSTSPPGAASRRITPAAAFRSSIPSSTQYWERTHAEHLFIPTFSTGPSGPYLPGTAIKGALRTGVVHGRLTERLVTDLAARIEFGGPNAAASGDLGGRIRAGTFGRRSVARGVGLRFEDRPGEHVQDLSAAHVDAGIARCRANSNWRGSKPREAA